MSTTIIGVSVHATETTNVKAKNVGSTVWVDIDGCTVFVDSPETAARIAEEFANAYTAK